MAIAQQAEREHRFDDSLQMLRSVVAAQPGHASAWLRLSHALQRENDYGGSLDACLRSASLVEGRPGAAALLPHVTMRLLAFDQRTRILDLVRAADPRDPRILGSAAVLAQHLWLCGYFEPAWEVVRAGLQANPDDPLLAHAEATVSRFMGREGEATEAYERAIRLAPGFADAHWALAYHQPSAPRGARLPRIREALRKTRRGTLDHAQLCYAAFKENDAAGNTDEAWRCLHEGAATMRALFPWFRDRESQRVDGIVSAALSSREGGVPDTNRGNALVPVFVVGLPRTGTTLLERMLGNHPDVAACGELNDFRQALCAVTGRFVSWPPDAREFSKMTPDGWCRVGEEYLRRVAPLGTGAAVIVDKNPLNFDAAGLVARALPAARILCLERDPMDAGFSNLKELFVGGGYGYSYDLQDIAARVGDFHRLAKHWESTIGNRFMRVKYEDMVRQPETTARAIIEFCGLEHREGVSRIVDNKAPVSTASSSQVREPIHARGIGAWRRYERQLAPLRESLARIGVKVN